jgi:signal transduction histidine kinase/tetratricopeptide (TPR) repeat protein
MKHGRCIAWALGGLLGAGMGSKAQTGKIDSLALAIEHRAKNDTVKVNWMVSLATQVVYSNPTRAMKVIDEELPLAESLHFRSGILGGYNVKSSIFIIQGNFQEGLPVCEKYLALARQYNDPPGIMAANNRIGIIYSQASNYPKALEYMLAALKIAEDLGDKKRTAATNQNIGNIYSDMEDYDQALEYYRKSIFITESIVPKTLVPPSLYNNIGIELVHQKKYDSAIANLQRGRTISEQTDNKRSLAGALTNLADAYHHLGDDEKSYQYGLDGLSISRQIGDKRAMANNFINIGISMNSISGGTLQAHGIEPRDRYPRAVKVLDSAVLLASEMGDLVTRDQAYKCETELSETQNHFPEAIASFHQYAQLHDTILNNDNQKGIERKLAQYEFDKKEAEIKLQQQITESRLKEQELLALQGTQQLRIKQNELALSNKDRALQKLSLQKQEADFLKEKQEKENIQALSDQKDRINTLEEANQRRFRYGLMAGLLLIAGVGALVYRQSTQRKAANEKLLHINAQLDEANKVKTRLFGILTHDLRSPVARLINFLNLQKQEPGMLTEEMKAQHQEKITHAAEDLLATIEDLLLWSKGQMKNFKPHIQEVSVQRLFDEIKALYPSNPGEQIDFDLEQNMKVSVDENYMKTILRNLTSNAIKAITGQGNGHIIWRAWQKENRKYLAISDNGPGISTAQQQVLFSDEASIGIRNGLGLSLIRDFAAAIRCQLSVDSQPGKGSTITLQPS